MLFNLVYCRLSRDRPAIPQILNITSGSGNNGEYFSDSNDSLYGEIQQQQHQQQQQQQSFKAWLQQQHQNTASSNSSECKKVLKVWTYSKRFIFPGSNQIRAANSLDSLDCVTSSIQQARANSLQRGQDQQQQQCYASPQLQRINRSNSMRYYQGSISIGDERRVNRSRNTWLSYSLKI